MNWFDIAIIAAIACIAFIGTKIGVVRAACVFGSFIVATIVGARASVVFAERLGELMHDPDLGYVVSFATVFILVFVGLSFVGAAISRVADIPPLSWIDGLIGGVLGFVAGIALIGLVIIYLTKHPVSNSEQWLKGSYLSAVVKFIISPIFQEFLRRANTATSVVFHRII